jgi:hypothetical protein
LPPVLLPPPVLLEPPLLLPSGSPPSTPPFTLTSAVQAVARMEPRPKASKVRQAIDIPPLTVNSQGVVRPGELREKMRTKFNATGSLEGQLRDGNL